MRLAVLVFFCLLPAASAEELVGRWEGFLQLPARTYDLILDLDHANGKDWVGSVIIPGLGIKGAALDQITVAGSQVSFALAHALSSPRVESPKFEARLNRGGELNGQFLQAGHTAPFTLRKTGSPQVELAPKSSAIGNEWAGEWQGDYEMNGYPRHVTLTLSAHGNEPATAHLVVVGKRTTDAPVDLVTVEDNFLTVQSREIGITFEGRLDKGAGQIRGSWTLGPFELPLLLKRTATSQ